MVDKLWKLTKPEAAKIARKFVSIFLYVLKATQS